MQDNKSSTNTDYRLKVKYTFGKSKYENGEIIYGVKPKYIETKEEIKITIEAKGKIEDLIGI